MAAIATAAVAATNGLMVTRRWPPLPVIIYLLAVLLPVSFWLGPLVMTGVRVFLLVMILPMALRLLSGRCGRLMIVDGLMVAHIIWATVALSVNNPDQVIQQAGSVGLEFIGGYVVGRTFIRSRDDFMALVRFLIMVVILVLPFTIFEALTGRSVLLDLLNKLPGLTAQPNVSTDKRLGLFRVQSTFSHPIHFGLFCSMVLSLCVVGLKDTIPDGRRIALGVLIAASGFLSLSSGALLALILQIGLIAWAFAFRGVEKRWWVLLGLFAVAYVVVDLLSNRTPIRVFMTYATFSSHTAYWRMIIFEWGMKNVWAHPIFGLGLNDWVRPVYMRSGSMDNFWLVMAVRYGIPGFLLIAAGYLIGLFRIMARDFRADPRLGNLRRAWVFMFVGLTFTLCTVHVWGNVYSFVFFMFGAGIWLIDAVPDGGGPAAAAVPQTELRGLRLRRNNLGQPAYTRFPGGAPLVARPVAPASSRAPITPNRRRPDGPSTSRFSPSRKP